MCCRTFCHERSPQHLIWAVALGICSSICEDQLQEFAPSFKPKSLVSFYLSQTRVRCCALTERMLRDWLPEKPQNEIIQSNGPEDSMSVHKLVADEVCPIFAAIFGYGHQQPESALGERPPRHICSGAQLPETGWPFSRFHAWRKYAGRAQVVVVNPPKDVVEAEFKNFTTGLRFFCEQEREGGVSPHVSPFAGVSDIGNLLTRAKFALPTGKWDFEMPVFTHPLLTSGH